MAPITAKNDSLDKDTLTLQPLETYKWPSLPAESVLWSLFARVRNVLRRNPDRPFIADERLKHAPPRVLDAVAAPPACGPLLREMDANFGSWATDSSDLTPMRLLVLPPCSEISLVEEWARYNTCEVLQPPARLQLTSGLATELPELSGDGLLVIPSLERWFLRHQNGLNTARLLLRKLGTLQRPCLIGCNSWAWAFLSKAADAQLTLPKAMAFEAFDGIRLQNWFSELAVRTAIEPVTFRLSESGEKVLPRSGDSEAHKYFDRLAARSLGIPSVAWHLWRRSLCSPADRNGAGEDIDSVPAAEEQTLWIAELEELTLPDQNEQDALLVLQALLIHGKMSNEELALAMPSDFDANVVPTLIGAGFVERTDDQLDCNPAAYPSIRRGVSRAGLPLGKL